MHIIAPPVKDAQLEPVNAFLGFDQEPVIETILIRAEYIGNEGFAPAVFQPHSEVFPNLSTLCGDIHPILAGEIGSQAASV